MPMMSLISVALRRQVIMQAGVQGALEVLDICDPQIVQEELTPADGNMKWFAVHELLSVK